MSDRDLPKELVHRVRDGVHIFVNPYHGGKFVTDDAGARVVELVARTADEEERIDLIARDLGLNPYETAARYVAFLGHLEKRRMLGGERAVAAGLPRPEYGFLEVTRRCSTRCRLCYVNSGEDRPDTLSREQILATVDQMAAAGVQAIALSGGDPLARPDMIEILEHAAGRGLVPGVSTSLLALTEETARRLGELGALVQVSLDGCTAETNDWNRGAGSFDKAMRGIDLLGRYQVPFRFACVINKRNLGDLEGMVALALDKGAREAAFARVKLAGRAREHAAEADPSREEMAAAYQTLYRKAFDPAAARVAIRCKHNQALIEGLGERVDCLPCGAGRTFVQVSYNGDIIPCSLLTGVERFVAGNVLTDRIDEVWERSPVFDFFRRTTADDVPACASCRVKHLCGGGCRGDAFLTSGDILGPCSDCGELILYYDTILERGLKKENVTVF